MQCISTLQWWQPGLRLQERPTVLPPSCPQRTHILPNHHRFVPVQPITRKTLPGAGGKARFSHISALVQSPAQPQFFGAFLAMPLQVPRTSLSDQSSHKKPACKCSQGSSCLRVGLTLCPRWNHTCQDRGMAMQTRLQDTIWKAESLPSRNIWAGRVWEPWKIGGW